MEISRKAFGECNEVLELVGRAMAHSMFRLFAKSMAFVADEGDNHAVQVEEEHQEVEAQLDEGFLEIAHTNGSVTKLMTKARGDPSKNTAKTNLLVHIQLAENLGRIQQVLVVVYPIYPERIPSD
jgi:hypothetical protein